MILNMDYLKMLLIVIILIVRLGMIFNALKLVTHMTPQQVRCIQTHPAHTHMIIFHNLTPQLTVATSNKHCISMKRMHHYLPQIQPHSVHSI